VALEWQAMALRAEAVGITGDEWATLQAMSLTEAEACVAGLEAEQRDGSAQEEGRG